jgi:hypothetical protein
MILHVTFTGADSALLEMFPEKPPGKDNNNTEMFNSNKFRKHVSLNT